MNQQTILFLVEKYNALHNKTPATCLKYHYQNNGVNVNVYFDAYDPRSLSLCLILACAREDGTQRSDYYFTPLNIRGTSIETRFLPSIPFSILKKILINSTLENFYETMETHIVSDSPRRINYPEDTFFTNTLQYQKTEYLPFLSHLRKRKMPEDTLDKLNASTDIPVSILRAIQRQGFTLVRTPDPAKRKTLTLILNNYNIQL